LITVLRVLCHIYAGGSGVPKSVTRFGVDSLRFHVSQEFWSVSVMLMSEPVYPLGTVSISINFTGDGAWYLNRLFVRQEHRGNGYGPMLLNKLWAALEERRTLHVDWPRVSRVIVHPGGYGSDPEELGRFYQHMGFSVGDGCLVKFCQTGKV